MKYTVKISDTAYEVDIEDIHARPIVARVNGERFEVQPEVPDRVETAGDLGEPPVPEAPKPVSLPHESSNELTAPLPGTVVDIFVKPGDEVEVGNVVLVIEAMKMKNSIRSTRAGTVTELLVSTGQTVAHKQALVRFE